ncbi:MAG: replicative DNA helicase, partial [Clostridia bacterium]|nr:replicative DNA helicase [Clostridia bacterium]
SLEQDADMVFLLYRKDYFDKSATDPAIVKVAKNRHGPTGNVEMAWLEKYTKFTTLESHHDEPEPW